MNCYLKLYDNMNMRKVLAAWAVALAVMCAAVGCVEERLTDDPSARLEFSCDTLVMDTLFAGVPSRTSRLMVYNRNDRALNISAVSLGGGERSQFRFNVDGHIPPEDNRLTDIVIKAKDSLYVFVELTAETEEEVSSLLVEDSLMFLCNGTESRVQLVACAKNARLLRNCSLEGDMTFDSVRPYLIYGYLHVPEGNTLTLTAGSTLYFHDGADLVVDGNLRSDGTLDAPVTLRGDRLDRMDDDDGTPYDYMPLQWGSVYLQNGLGRHSLTHTVIRGGTHGIVLYGERNAAPVLTMKNCVVTTAGGYGLYSRNGDVEMENCVISNCGAACCLMLGGRLGMTHCTVANYYTYGTRSTPAFVVTNYETADGGASVSYPVKSAVVENSIIYGGNGAELALMNDTLRDTEFNVLISYTLVKGEQQDGRMFNRVLWSGELGSAADAVFMNTDISDIEETGYYDFSLAPRSPAIGVANKEVAIHCPEDIRGVSRTDDDGPDMGAYERTED